MIVQIEDDFARYPNGLKLLAHKPNLSLLESEAKGGVTPTKMFSCLVM